MPTTDSDAAVAAALSLNWKKALEINAKILAGCPNDTDCLNRLGRAYLELGDAKKAIFYSKKVLKINKYDPIAAKNLARATQIPKVSPNDRGQSLGQTLTRPVSFLEEPGKTKLVSLVNVAPAKTLLNIDHADAIRLLPRRHALAVTDSQNNYLGAFPDDLGHRLLILIKGGNKYEAFIKSVSKGMVTVFVREVIRAKKFRNTPSFSASSADYLSFVREDLSEESRDNSASVSDEGENEDDLTTVSKAQALHFDEEPEANS